MKPFTQNSKLDFYSFFTKYSLLDNYGFASGLLTRLARKLVPNIPPQGTLSFAVLQASRSGQSIEEICAEVLRYLDQEEHYEAAARDLNRAISALFAKLIGFGFDYRMQQYFEELSIDTEGFQGILESMDALAHQQDIDPSESLNYLDAVIFAIQSLRREKRLIGTSLHLTVITKRLLDYAEQSKKLVNLKGGLKKEDLWKELIKQKLLHIKEVNSLSKFFKNHTDMLALEIVEHTSSKGENYVAEDAKAYRKFFRKGLLGGILIAIFALLKAIIDNNFSGDLTLAFIYGLNYASCFVLVKVMGGTIATKQPAMTASTIIRYVGRNESMQIGSVKDIIVLLRRVSRGQFISLIGNFLMALLLACLIGYIFTRFPDLNPIKPDQAEYLLNHAWPIKKGALLYAAVAGFFLSLSGFISGYVDNKVLASRLPYRLLHHSLLKRVLPKSSRQSLAKWTEKKLGSMSGNVVLGFFLGAAFLLSYVLPFKVDIRHVAFSSANAGYGIINVQPDWGTIFLVLLSVLLIGFVNFLVSFSLTFYVALKSRGVTTNKLLHILRMSFLDIIKHPLDYVMVRDKSTEQT